MLLVMSSPGKITFTKFHLEKHKPNTFGFFNMMLQVGI